MAALATIVVAFAAFAASAAARPAPEGVVVEGLSDPRGIDAITNRAMLVAESGSGSITLVQQKRKGGARVSTFASFPVDPEGGGPVDVASKGLRKTWVLAAGNLVRLDRKGRVNLTVDIPAYQEGDPDPDDLEGLPEESNPNGLALLRGGGVLVADAAGNDLLLLDKASRSRPSPASSRSSCPGPPGCRSARRPAPPSRPSRCRPRSRSAPTAPGTSPS